MSFDYREIFENNRRWAAERIADDPHFFERMAREQKPDMLYIGCSDSRVPANEITGLDPGELFVHRNIANVVANLDASSQSVVQFAVEHLGVQHIAVCGHYGCGGVKAAMQSADYGLLNPWLRNIRDVYRLHLEELDAIADERARFDRLVELNVIEQCINVLKMAVVQKRFIRTGYPKVHAWVYDMRTGLLRDLDLHDEEILEEVRRIYRLTE